VTDIRLTRAEIDRALRALSKGREDYVWLQTEFRRRDVASDREFQKRFNGFYRVRRNAEWQRAFYDILEGGKSKRPSLAQVLRSLHRVAGRVEASFASKLMATLDPAQPVIDSIVLGNLGLRLPPRTETVAQRIDHVVALHARLADSFSGFLKSDTGRFLVKRFGEAYPTDLLTEVKMIDLVLWQTR
jgi:hypothetical protein